MEQYVKALFDRLEGENKTKLFVLMQGAIDEMHNNQIISQVDRDGTSPLHDPDPEVRVTEKTILAKTVGSKLIVRTIPLVKDGILMHYTEVNYDDRFNRSIGITIQGGLEGLHMTGLTKKGGTKYIVFVNENGQDISEFKEALSWLNDFYDDIEIVVETGEEKKAEYAKLIDDYENRLKHEKNREAERANQELSSSGSNAVSKTETSPQKGFFSRLFGSGKTRINNNLMISQYAAHYVLEDSLDHKLCYINKLSALGFTKEEAEKLLEFEADIIRKYNKQYLLKEDYTESWMMTDADSLDNIDTCISNRVIADNV